MKTRVVLILFLLMFVFCTASLSRAAWDHRYNIHFLSPPCEHPWQESGSPNFDDTIRPNTASQIFIEIGPVKLIIIRPFWIVSMLNKIKEVNHSPKARGPK